MLKSVEMGKYIEGNSLLHRVNPKSKLLVVTVYLAVLLVTPFGAGILLYAVGMLAATTLVGIPLTRSLRGVRPLVKLAFVALVANAFFTGGTALAESGALQYISQEGCIRSLTMLARLLTMAWLTSLLTATTPPIALMDSVTSILVHLEKIKIPVSDAVRILSLAISLLPVVASKAESFLATRSLHPVSTEGLSKKNGLDDHLGALTEFFTELYAHGNQLATTLEMNPQSFNGYKKGGSAVRCSGDDLLFIVGALSYLVIMIIVALR